MSYFCSLSCFKYCSNWNYFSRVRKWVKRLLLIILVRWLSIVSRHFYNPHWNFICSCYFLASKLLNILFIWSTVAALIFLQNKPKFIFNAYNARMMFELVNDSCKNLFSLTLLAKVLNFVGCLPVVLFTMLI